jgi:hypothetical protein
LDYLDIVKAKRRLTEMGAVTGEQMVEAGTTGTILMVYDERVGDKPKPGEPLDFEVEFTDDDSNTIAIMTVSEEDLELVTPYKPAPQYEWIEPTNSGH